MVSRPTGRFGFSATEAELPQGQFVDERIDCPDWVVLGDVLVDAGGKQRTLGAVFAFNESLHR
jgi:hypothetical protein